MMFVLQVILFFSGLIYVHCSMYGYSPLSPISSHLSSLSNKPSSSKSLRFQHWHSGQSSDSSVVIPQYMVDLYKKLVKNPNSLPFGADFVRSFTNTGHKMAGAMSVFKFALKIPVDEKITHAILQVCFPKGIERSKHHPSFIQVFDLTAEKVNGRGKFYGRRCAEVPVKNAVERAFVKRLKSASLILGIKIYHSNNEAKIDHVAEAGPPHQHPALIVFTRSNKRRRHSVITQNFAPSINKKRSLPKNGCKTKSLFVNFAGLGYKDIIVPTIFDAKQCAGQCTYPLGKLSNPAQHSLIQQLLFSLYGPRVARPTCCAPRKFLPLTVMVNDTFSGGIVIRSLEEMVVAECGCI